MSNSKLDNYNILFERALARSERRPLVSLYGEAGIKKALKANRTTLSLNAGPAAFKGRKQLLGKSAVLPTNSMVPSTIESTARVAGWLKAALEDRKCFAALAIVKSVTKSPSRNAINPMHFLNKWVSPRNVTVEQMRAVRWLTKTGHNWTVFTPRALHQLGKLSPMVRWAAIAGVSYNAGFNSFTHRQLRWDNVEKAQKGIRAASEFFGKIITKYSYDSKDCKYGVDPKYTWGYTLGYEVLKAIEAGLSYNSISPIEYRKVINSLEENKVQPEIADAVYRLCLLFGTERNIRTWVKKTQGDYTSRSIHDAAQSIPMMKFNKRWAGLLLTATSQFTPYISILNKIEEFCTGTFPKSIREVVAIVENNNLGMYLGNLTDKERNFLVKTPTKSYEALPNVEVVNGKYVLRKVAYNSVELLTAGKQTNCCQHLDGAGASCAAAAWEQSEAGIYAVYVGTTMIAQTFAWRSKDGESLVLDSIECKSDSYGKVLVEMFIEMAEKIVGRLSIKRVLVPTRCNYGITKIVSDKAILNGGKFIETPTCAFYLGYSDAGRECVVLAKTKTKQHPMKTQTTVKPKFDVVNVLQEGSDVFCEYCEAEVHPACEICPSCNANIVEWV